MEYFKLEEISVARDDLFHDADSNAFAKFFMFLDESV